MAAALSPTPSLPTACTSVSSACVSASPNSAARSSSRALSPSAPASPYSYLATSDRRTDSIQEPEFMNQATHMPARKISVMIVDDHPLMRIGVAAIINARSDMEVVAQAGTAEEAVARHNEDRPAPTLMDLGPPGS